MKMIEMQRQDLKGLRIAKIHIFSSRLRHIISPTASFPLNGSWREWFLNF